MEENRDLKVMLIGNSSVGKTSLIVQYKSKKFSNQLCSTVGVDLTIDKNVTINNQLYDIAIWDTAGQEKYRAIVKISCQKSDVAILCFDLNDPISLESVASWIEFLRSNAPVNMQIIVVGTKKDLPIHYTSEQLQQVRIAWQANFNEEFQVLLTSSKTGEGLEEAFSKAFELGAKAKYEGQHNSSEPSKKASFKISTASVARSRNLFQKTEPLISNVNSQIKSEANQQPDKQSDSGCC